ncbi:MAG TPA: ABC transporter transmembrane domain-containing protein [Oligoflexus sp.]|uniref:ABC transporter ATP-binding protein n=1 Tax=Oligoflexus sp. TaxID=1971216 RepID=UPI002D40FA3D|nr:ABC transporter transmembrane domain-containing protein [Oligoflexus sp.]HYX35763.1 ABC transporter transmembrane domain-containing protein [Oligoflexus sp.]
MQIPVLRLDKATAWGQLLRLFKLALPEWKKLIFGFIALVLSSSMVLVYPQAVKYIIDEVLETGRFDLLKPVVGLVFLVFLLQAVSAAFRYYIFTAAGERIVTRLRQSLYQAVLKQEIAFFDARQTGELMSRLASDATVVQNAVTLHFSSFLQHTGIVLFGTILLIRTSAVMAIGFLIAIPLIVVSTGFFGKRIQKLAREGQDAWGQSASIAAETISGIRTVRAFIQEQGEAHRYARAVTQALELGRLRIQNIACFIGIGSLLGSVTIAGVLWYGGDMVLTGVMTLGDLTSFLLYALSVTVSLGSLGSLWTDFMSTLGASERIFELLDRQPKIPLSSGLVPPHISGRVQFQRVQFCYPARPDIPVLKELSFSVEPGQVIALVGPSGSGKSTIASLLTRFYDPIQGAILLDGTNIRNLNSAWLRRQIGVVSQDPFLMSDTIAANIRYGRVDASDAAVRRAAYDAHAHDFIEGFPNGYQTLVGERGLQLSGGQRQRIAIARALLKDPRILILDEATSALDAESEYLVQEALERLMEGRTTLVIAHRLSTVKHADRVLVMEHGKIIQSGTHKSLMQNTAGIYYRLAYRQLHGL